MAKAEITNHYNKVNIIPMQVLPSFQNLANNTEQEEQMHEEISERHGCQQYVLAQPNQAIIYSSKIQKEENREKKYTPLTSSLTLGSMGFSMAASILISAGPVITGAFFLLPAAPISMVIIAGSLFVAGIVCTAIALAMGIAAWKIHHTKKSSNASVEEPNPVSGTYSKLQKNEGLQPKQIIADTNKELIDLKSHGELFNKQNEAFVNLTAPNENVEVLTMSS